jgi:protein-S-isoprenylcysteine O-methyltransferase Ste14
MLELRIPPLFLAAGFAAAVVAGSVLMPWANLPFPGHRGLALAAMVLGPCIAALGVLQFRQAHTTINPKRPARARSVVNTGVYRFSRNPMYLGMALALLGLAAWRSSLPGYLAVALFVTYMTRYQIRPEEQALLAKFGGEFAAYQARVRRWL